MHIAHRENILMIVVMMNRINECYFEENHCVRMKVTESVKAHTVFSMIMMMMLQRMLAIETRSNLCICHYVPTSQLLTCQSLNL